MNTLQVETVFDPEIIEDLAAVFGRQRLMDLLAGLEREIAQRLAPASTDLDDLSHDAHVLVSVSGSLGFLPLSQACATLERVCLDGGDPVPALAAVRKAATEAQRYIVLLRSR